MTGIELSVTMEESWLTTSADLFVWLCSKSAIGSADSDILAKIALLDSGLEFGRNSFDGPCRDSNSQSLAYSLVVFRLRKSKRSTSLGAQYALKTPRPITRQLLIILSAATQLQTLVPCLSFELSGPPTKLDSQLKIDPRHERVW